jgi:hypothetical protein
VEDPPPPLIAKIPLDQFAHFVSKPQKSGHAPNEQYSNTV